MNSAYIVVAISRCHCKSESLEEFFLFFCFFKSRLKKKKDDHIPESLGMNQVVIITLNQLYWL